MYNKCEDKRHTTNVKTKGIQQRRRQSLQVKPDHVAITILVKKTAISKHYFILLYISYKHVIYCSLLFQKKNRNLCGSVQILCFCNGVPPTKNVSTKLQDWDPCRHLCIPFTFPQRLDPTWICRLKKDMTKAAELWRMGRGEYCSSPQSFHPFLKG